jgi:hypothetical protein
MRIKNIVGIFIIFSLFAGNASASFLDDEAGISAYTKANTAINLNNAKNAFRTIERQTSDYIVGSVAIPGLPETEDAHVYVNQSGWILAYYLKDVPVSKIVQWSGYSGGTVTTTTLADAISNVATSAGVSFSNTPVKYYDFKYPGANRVMMIIDWLPTDGTDSYDFKTPGSYILNENSWSFRYGGLGGCYNTATYWQKIDGTIFPDSSGSYSGTGYSAIYGTYSTILSPDVFHSVSIGTYCVGAAGVNTVLVYQEP